jgi:hypothetical protein
MALSCAAMMAAVLGLAPPAQAAFVFGRTDVNLSSGTNQRLVDVATGDLDRANGPDIVASALNDNRVYVLRNRGNGSFAAPVPYSACGTLNGAPMQLVTAQLNVAADQLLDVGVACGTLTLLRGNGLGALSAPAPTSQSSKGSLAAAELTGGGGPELVTGAAGPTASQDTLCFVVQPFGASDSHCGNPAPFIQPPFMASTLQGPVAGTTTPIAANFSDAPGTRHDELVAVNPDNPREINVYGRDPGLGYDAWSATMRATSADRAYFADVGDLEGDGDRDLFVGHQQGGVFDVFVWGPAGILPGAVPRTTRTLGVATTDGKLADLDRDGRLDAVVAGVAGELAIHPGRGDGTFGPATRISVPAASGAVLALANLGGDSKLDIVLGTSHGSPARSDQVSVLINRTTTGGGSSVARPRTGILGLRTRFRVGRPGRLRLARAVSPPASATRQRLTALVSAGRGRARKRVAIGSGRTAVPAGTRRAVVLRLNRRGKRLLRGQRRMRAQLVLVARGPTGLSDTITRRVRLSRARR